MFWGESPPSQLGKTKELVVDFPWIRKQPTLYYHPGGGNRDGGLLQVPGVHINSKPDRTDNTEALYQKAQSGLFFLKRVNSLDVCSRLLQMFYHSVVASTLYFAVACWEGSKKAGETNRVNKQVRKASSVVGLKLDSWEAVVEKKMRENIKTILAKPSHLLYEKLWLMESTVSHRLICLLFCTLVVHFSIVYFYIMRIICSLLYIFYSLLLFFLFIVILNSTCHSCQILEGLSFKDEQYSNSHNILKVCTILMHDTLFK